MQSCFHCRKVIATVLLYSYSAIIQRFLGIIGGGGGGASQPSKDPPLLAQCYQRGKQPNLFFLFLNNIFLFQHTIKNILRSYLKRQ
jgi:hypothetical protein